jgi:hypothetical protein
VPTTKPIVIAAVSDFHLGSTLGLMPPEGVRLPDGNPMLPNKAQEWSWLQWEKYWTWIGELRRSLRAMLIHVYVGDLFESNVFAKAAQTISQNSEPKAYIADRAIGKLSRPWALKPTHTIIVRGTEVHVGPVGESEEAFARSIRAELTPDKAWSWWEFRPELHGHLLDFRHHPSNYGTKPWTDAAAVVREAKQVFYTHAEAGQRAPEIAVRGHVHYHGDSYDACPTRAIFLPPWQFKTMHARKVASNANLRMGGIAIILEPNKKPVVDKQIYQPEQEAPWSPSTAKS